MKRFLLGSLGLLMAGCLSAFGVQAQAQSYPDKPIKLIVPWAPGGPADQTARLVAEKLQEKLGAVVVENRPGAGGTVGAAMSARAPADGYTVFLNSAAIVLGQILYPQLSYNVLEDLEPVGLVAAGPLVMMVNSEIPVKTVSEFIDYAKKSGNRISFGSAGIGTNTHLAGEIFKVHTGIDMTHVPYRGASGVVPDLLTSRVQAAFIGLDPNASQYIRDGKLTALAVTSGKRFESLPDIPTVAESGLSDFEILTWYGLSVPKGTPAEIKTAISNALDGFAEDPRVKDFFSNAGLAPSKVDPDALSNLQNDEFTKYSDIVKRLGIKLEQ